AVRPHQESSTSSSIMSSMPDPDSLLPTTDLTHSSNIMSGRRVSQAEAVFASAMIDQPLIDPASLLADNASAPAVRYSHVSYQDDENEAVAAATAALVGDLRPQPSLAMQQPPTNSFMDTRRISLPMLAMTSEIKPDGSLPIHARRKIHHRSRSTEQTPIINEHLPLRSHSISLANDFHRFGLHGEMNSNILTQVSIEARHPLDTQMPSIQSTETSPMPFQQQPQQEQARTTLSDSESDEDFLPCEISRLPKSILFNGNKAIQTQIGNQVPGPSEPDGGCKNTKAAALMTTFNSKISGSAQKKHKCPVCHKRFTRPSSLQTHMYSHTGEKPFICDFNGCGRHFSVVSNLRRHKKIHSVSN
ncbi:hypothetical protein V1514DRAFT_264709, partial [Lipomyces japonicus]|uniref:uncharacterized protein n=1 Tax=Lipomyces japonicus TaxID=56871 RepID=UPI0034CE5C27